MKMIIKSKIMAAIAVTAVVSAGLGVASIFDGGQSLVQGLNLAGTYSLAAFAEESNVTEQTFTVNGENVDVTTTKSVTSKDGKYMLYVTAIDTNDLSAFENTSVGYNYNGKQYSGAYVENQTGLSKVVYSSLSIRTSETENTILSINDMFASEIGNFTPEYVRLVIAEIPIVAEAETATLAVEAYTPISTKEEFLAIWTGNNEESLANMNYNYVLKDDIDLGANGKVIGVGDTSGYVGFSGIFDGNGYTISWTNTISVGWNSGFIARVNEGGVIKNLGLQGIVKGAIAGPIGLVYGTVENCFFDVDVEAINANQAYGTGIAALCGNGIFKNSIAVGTVTGLTTCTSGVYGKTHDGGKEVNATNCYALSGTVTSEANVLTDEQMKTASTFEGWDTSVWYITNGVYPMLKYAGFEAPTAIAINNETTVGSNIDLEIDATVTGSGSWKIISVDTSDSNIVWEDGSKVVKVGYYTPNGATFTVKVAAEYAPEIIAEKMFTVSVSSMATFEGTPETITYSGSDEVVSAGTYLKHNMGDSATVAYSLGGTYEGVTINSETGVITVGAASNNKEEITVNVTVSNGTETKEASFKATIVNEVFKTISTEAELVAALSNQNAVTHLYNNYRLTSNIELTSAWVPYINKAAGYAGTFDGNGYAISNLTIKSNGGWNTGFFGCIAANGVVKNLELVGSENGVYAKWGGAMAGYLYGTIENCFVNVYVYSDNGSAPCGTIAGSAYSGSKISNCIVIGKGEQKATTATRGAGLVATYDSEEIVQNTFVLSGTVDGLSGEKTAPVAERTYGTSEAELKTASTFAG
ncbi:MAG: hypothetical protein ACI4MQ_07970 [Candidatus Coproplasma sp.]